MANSQDDLDAALELAAELPNVMDAGKFIRAETGLSLRESIQQAQKVARKHPQSKLGQSYAALPWNSPWR